MEYTDYQKETNPVVTMEVKDYGVMEIELFPEVAKNTVDNFLKYVRDNFYEGLDFHRVIKGFMIQGGQGKNLHCRIKGEFNSNGFDNPLKHTRGVISMARTMNKDSATSQFFIMHQDAPHLDGEYAGFGALTTGLDCLDKIASVKTNHHDMPFNSVTITKVSVELNGYTPSEPLCLT